MRNALLLPSLFLALTCHFSTAAEPAKDAAIRKGGASASPAALIDKNPGGAGHRLTLTNGVANVPVIVVRGTPYQMGWQLGRLMREEIQQLAPAVVAGFKKELRVTDETLDLAWATTAGYTDARVQQQLVGLAEGSGQPVRLMQHVHCLPLLMPYSCSSIAAWGESTEDGHLYQTRNQNGTRWATKPACRANTGCLAAARGNLDVRTGPVLQRERRYSNSSARHKYHDATERNGRQRSPWASSSSGRGKSFFR